MRAAQFDSYGPSQVLRVSEVAQPTFQPNGVLVRVRAASVNPHDTIVRSGKLRIVTGSKFPLGTGLDFAGEISAIGEDIHDFAVGERVWGTVPVTGKHTTAAAAEYVAVPSARVARTPEKLTDVQAAALAVVGTTAFTALADKVKLKRGERVLVRGAAGGVGAAAVQLAHAMGGHITALASARDADYVRSLGADEVLDYVTARPKDLPAFDVILDTAGASLESFRRRLASEGRMVTVNFGSASAMLSIGLSTLFGSRRIRTFSADPMRREFDALALYIEAGTLRPEVGEVFPLEAISAAHTALETKGGRGKCVITL